MNELIIALIILVISELFFYLKYERFRPLCCQWPASLGKQTIETKESVREIFFTNIPLDRKNV